MNDKPAVRHHTLRLRGADGRCVRRRQADGGRYRHLGIRTRSGTDAAGRRRDHFQLDQRVALVAGDRGDLAAKRVAIIEPNKARRHRLRVGRSELTSLAPARAAAEIEADMAKLLAENPRAGDCHVMDGPVSRTMCPQVAALNGEIAQTRRRAELRGDMAKLTDAMPASVGTSDPASAALSAYLAALLGMRLPASAIAQWLLLLPVLALELGAALAVVVVVEAAG